MDLQKVVVPANSNASQNGGRLETDAGKSASSGLPFVDMIRMPLIGFTDIFANLGNSATSPDTPRDDYRRDDSDEHRPSDEANARKDAPEHTQREDNARANNPDNDRVEKGSSRNDNTHDDHEPGEKQDNHAAKDDDNTPSDDVATETVEDTDTAPTDNTDDDSADVAASAQNTRSESAESAGSNNLAFEPALASVVGAAQGADQNQTVKDAAQTLKEVVAGPRQAKAVDAPTQQMTGNNTGSDQDADGEAQQALRQVVRQGVSQGASQSNHAAETANKPADQTLAQQQAKMLSDSLKSDKPVKVTVNTENRANVAVSQPSQSLSASALPAQNSEGPSQSGMAQQANTRPSQLQGPAHNMANPNGVQAQAQAQVASQASDVAAASAADRGIARAMAQTTAGQHGNTGGAESTSNTTATTPGSQAQLATAAQKPQAAQAPRAAQPQHPITQQISVNITKAIAEGMDRVSIQLRPSELGRVEVKLEIGQNGRVSAQIIADRPEALEALRNDSRSLEKALQDAGLQANAGDLSFSLRDQQDQQDAGSEKRMAGGDEDDVDGDLEAELATRILNDDLDGFVSDTRVDIRA